MDIQKGLQIAGEAVAFLTALATFLGTIRNGLTHLGWLSTEESTKIGKFLDRMAWVAEKGKEGLAGAASLPGFASKAPAPALAAVPPARGDKGSAEVRTVVGLSLLSAAFFALVLAGIFGGCATTSTPASAPTMQKFQADVAATQTIAKDVVAKCGPQFAPVAPLIADALSIAADPYNVLADVMTVVSAVPAIAQDVKGLECVVRTVGADYKALFQGRAASDMGKPTAQLIWENAEAVADLLAQGVVAPQPAADMACASLQ